VQHLDIWETTYTHVLDGDDPVAHWAKSTGLRPFLNRLDDEAATLAAAAVDPGICSRRVG